MNEALKFNQLGKIKGVHQFVVADSNGLIIIENTTHLQELGNLVLQCGQLFTVIGKSGFKHAVFERKNLQNILIFPVGNYYLGVIKEQDIENNILINDIKRFLADLY